MTHFHIASATAARTLPGIERKFGCGWRHLGGKRRASQGETHPATELCGEIAEFGGMLGGEEDL